jgi:hypothetical protein
MRSRAAAAAVAAITSVLLAAGTATAAPTWAPAATAPVHPGVMTHTQGGQCTSNFVFYDAANTVYIGQAAHCSGTGGATETNGCDSGSLPLGTPVTVDGASRPGTMVYNSWLAMQAARETNANACEYNDFAVVRLDPADFGKVNPSIPFWGGPTGTNTTGTAAGDKVLSYGNSSLRGGQSALSPKEGTSLGTNGGGWNHPVFTASPGIPGDSGSAFIDRQGRALGVLATLQVAPFAGSNGVGDISRELAYANSHSTLGLTLATGTVAFRGPIVAVL